MHPDEKSNKPGKCPKCGMNLEPQTDSGQSNNSESTQQPASYKPLFIIIGLIFTATITLTIKDYLSLDASLSKSMSYFMAGFFLVFSGFKLLDLRGFAHAYATYDLLAGKFPRYGYLYPFLEFGLGLAYISDLVSIPLNIFTVILMGFSGLGVLTAISQKRKFQCACLGTIIKLPLTHVTLIEDFGMATMALLGIFV